MGEPDRGNSFRTGSGSWIWLLSGPRHVIHFYSTNRFSFLASSTPLHSHRCSLPHRTLWFGQASLYEDRIHIRGWTWQGRYQREVLVEDIEEVEWRPRPERPNLFLHLEDGKTIPIRLHKGAGLWNAKLHDLLDQSLLDKRGVPKSRKAEEDDEAKDDEDQTAV